MHTQFPSLLNRVRYRYPSFLVDAVADRQSGERLVAVKNVTVNEEFFQGHFPGTPLMPGVLMIEALAQVAGLLLLGSDTSSPNTRVFLCGVDRAKFRRQVVPGDRLRLEVRLARRRSTLARVVAGAFVGDQAVAEAELLMAIEPGAAWIDPSAIIHPSAQVGEGTHVGPHAMIGANVSIGRNCRIGASALIDGWTEIGDGNEIYPMASIGLPPQDLKYRGERTRLTIGQQNVFREFVTVHRGTQGGGGETSIGDRNLFMAYVHVAHDCHIGSSTIFANGATLAGHVTVEDFATISAFSGVHQFCRVGQHAYIGGYSVVTKDALPYGKSVGNRARSYGLNTIGLVRRGFTGERVGALKRAYRYLLTSKLNTTRALAEIECDPALAGSPDVRYLVEFIRTSQRGVVLRRAMRKADEILAEE